MKKAFAKLFTFGLVSTPLLTILGVVPVYAYDSQVCMQYDDGVVCASVDEQSNDFEFEVRVTNYERSGSPSLRCEMRHSSSSATLFEECKDEIRYTGNNGTFIIDAVLNGENGTFIYDIDDEEWDTSLSEVSGGNTNSDDIDEIRVDSDSSDHDRNQWIDIDIEVLEDGDTVENFDERVRFSVEVRSSGGSWFTASTSDYDLDRTSYTFSNSDDGEVTLNDLIRFTDDGDYRLKVYLADNSNIRDYDYFDIGSSSNNNNNNDDIDNFRVVADDDQVDEDERVYFDVDARDDDNDILDDYRGTIEVKVYRRSSSSSSWSNITSSNDNNSNYRISDHEYTFSSSDDGEANNAFWIEFKNDNYDYRVEVEDDDDSSADGEEIVYLRNSSGSSNNDDVDEFEVKADDDEPNENERVEIAVKAVDDDGDVVDDYDGEVVLKVYRRSSSSSSWSNITSSSDNNSNYEVNDHTYNFSSSDDGDVDDAFEIRFKNDNYDYRIIVEDDDDSSVEGEEIIYLRTSGNGSNDDIDNFKVVADDDEVDEDERVYFDVDARDDDNDILDDYRGTIEVKVYRRSSSSSSWSNITSSSDNNSNYRISDHDYTFDSSDDGEANNAFWIEFKNDNYDYRVEVEDEDDSSADGEEIVYLRNSSSSSNNDVDRISVKTDDSTPDRDEYVDLIIELLDDDGDTVEDFTDTVEILVYYDDDGTYRRTTSSSFYTMSDDEYDFTSSDNGEVRLSNWIKFKKNEKYKVIVQLEDDSDIDGSRTFTVGSADSLDTTTQDPDQFRVEVLTKDVEVNDRIDLTITARTDDNERSTSYRDKIEFKIQEVDDAGRTNWSTADNGDYTRYLSSYTFSNSDGGEKSLYDIIKFTNEGYYKIIIEDDNDNDLYGAAYVFIPDVNYDNSIPGFSSSERNRVRSYYEVWPVVINRLLGLYPELHDNDDWEQEWMDFYERLEKTVTDSSGKFSSYEDFEDEFRDWARDLAREID